MDHVFQSGASATPPSAPASPSVGYPIGGDPGTGTPATKPGPYWYYMISEEQRAVIVAAGLTPDHLQTTQLRDAILALIAAGAANDYKASVRAATTANIAALVGGAPSTLDGVTLAANNRILVKDQTTASQNGIYYVATLGTGANGTWTRATDADGAGELTSGAIVAVEEGTTNADSQWMLTTDGTITIGTTSLTFARTGSTARQIQPAPTPTLSANAMTIPVAQYTLDFRKASLTSGGVDTVTGTPAALTIPAGATLGTTSAVQSSIAVLVLNNAGTQEYAVVNQAGSVNLSEEGVISTTAISAAATSANVAYSNTARTNVPYRVVQRLDSTQATSGQWATQPSLAVGMGGQVLASIGAASVSSNGYQKLPSGLILQWGSWSGGSTSGSVTFPIAFLNACLSTVMTTNNNAASAANLSGAPTKTGFGWYSATGTVGGYWIAIGW